MANPNIVVVGLVRLAHEADWDTDALTRDNLRINELQRKFNTIFSIAPDTAGKPIDIRHHIKHSIGKEGAFALIELMNKYHPAGKLIHHVCIEYVRVPAPYYRPFIIGSTVTAGKVLTDFAHGDTQQ